ncbi:unnamed protein product [Bathycoccus prasinos]
MIRCARCVYSRKNARISRITTTTTTASSSSSSSGKKNLLQQQLDTNRIKNRRECLPIPTAIIAVKSAGGGDENSLYKKLELDFETMIKRYAKFEMISCPQNPKNEKGIEEQKESEGERVMKKIDSRDFVVLMCERGQSYTSERFASDVLCKSGDLGHGRLVFVIGGPFGHGEEVRARADVSLRLSEMVMNHRVARMVLLEQIYRAWTIVRGEPYHH